MCSTIIVVLPVTKVVVNNTHLSFHLILIPMTMRKGLSGYFSNCNYENIMKCFKNQNKKVFSFQKNRDCEDTTKKEKEIMPILLK
jgi:hypothetical protein